MVRLGDVEFKWLHPINKNIVRTKVMVLVGVCDSVARPLLQNLKQFIGEYGCGFSLDAGVINVQGLGTTRAPFVEQYVLRTEKSTTELAK